MAELSAQGPVGLPGGTSVVFTTPFPLRPGSRASDSDGNIYVFCDFTGTVYGRQPVAISADFTAAAVGTTHRGAIGIACGAATSDNAGWVQVYGRALVQLGQSGVSPSDAANGPTTLSTSAATIFALGTSLTSPNGIGYVSDPSSTDGRFVIKGMVVATDVSLGDVSAVTSATSHSGNQVAVMLNFPVVEYISASPTS